MADEQKEQQTQTGEPQEGGKPAGQAETDWQAKYEKAIAESRKWETRSKENKKALDELKASADKTLEERTSQLEGELKRLQDESARKDLIAKVSQEKGVPASLLQGDTEEELNESADSILEFAKSASTVAPIDKGGSPQKSTASTADLFADALSQFNN